MDRAFRSLMTIRILLPEDSDEIKSSKASAVRHCGQGVEGYLEVITAGDFLFEIDVAFEGLVRTWLGPNNDYSGQFPQTAETQFLRQNQHISSNSSAICYKDHSYVYHLPFQFVIPQELISARSDVRSDFLQLCPSAKLGHSLIGPKTGKIYYQPSISYMVRIIRVRTEVLMPSPIRCHKEREITVMPYLPAAPPLEIEHFPHEYKMCATTAVKQRIWKRTLGLLYISTEEPAPLNVSVSTPRASTVISVWLTFVSKPPYEIDVCPYQWKLTAKYCLRSRTFYSTQKLERVPTAFDTRTNSHRRMHEEKTSWEVRGFGGVNWRRDSWSGNGSSLRNESWTTNLFLPINAAKDLLPTFLNTLSSRQYSLVIQLVIEGHHHSIIELTVPVQVINYPVEVALSAAYTEMEPSNHDHSPGSLNSLSVESMALRDDGNLDVLEDQVIFPPPYEVI